MYNNQEYRMMYLQGGPGTAQIFSGRGRLHNIMVGITNSQSIQVFDMVNPGTLSNTNTAMVLKASVAEGNYFCDAAFANGCYLTYGAGGAYTVTYTQG